MVKKILKWTGIVVAALLLVGAALYFIYLKPVMTKIMTQEEVVYDPNLTILLGGGGNSGILTSDSLVLVIDTKMDEPAQALYEKVNQLKGNRKVIVVNTHYHPDHCKGNKFYTDALVIAGANYGKEAWLEADGEATLPNYWLKDSMTLPMGDETVTIFNIEGNTHTASDVMVYLHKRKMLFAGDVILNGQVPAMRDEHADPDGYTSVMDELPQRFAIETIVPGHGAIGGMEVLKTFRQYFTDMQTAVQDPSKKDELVAKYKDWNQLPLMMSPGVTIDCYKKKMNSH